jgi:hypothetical protein
LKPFISAISGCDKENQEIFGDFFVIPVFGWSQEINHSKRAKSFIYDPLAEVNYFDK